MGKYIQISKDKPLEHIQQENLLGKIYFSNGRIFLGTKSSANSANPTLQPEEYCANQVWEEYNSNTILNPTATPTAVPFTPDEHNYYVSSVQQNTDGSLTGNIKRLPIIAVNNEDVTGSELKNNEFKDFYGATITLNVDENGKLIFNRYKESSITMNVTGINQNIIYKSQEYQTTFESISEIYSYIGANKTKILSNNTDHLILGDITQYWLEERFTNQISGKCEFNTNDVCITEIKYNDSKITDDTKQPSLASNNNDFKFGNTTDGNDVDLTLNVTKNDDKVSSNFIITNFATYTKDNKQKSYTSGNNIIIKANTSKTYDKYPQDTSEIFKDNQYVTGKVNIYLNDKLRTTTLRVSSPLSLITDLNNKKIEITYKEQANIENSKTYTLYTNQVKSVVSTSINTNKFYVFYGEYGNLSDNKFDLRTIKNVFITDINTLLNGYIPLTVKPGDYIALPIQVVVNNKKSIYKLTFIDNTGFEATLCDNNGLPINDETTESTYMEVKFEYSVLIDTLENISINYAIYKLNSNPSVFDEGEYKIKLSQIA